MTRLRARPLGRRSRPVEPTRLAVRDLVDEAVAATVARPGRAALTVIGTLLGVAAFVAVLGLTTTASGQISRRFTALAATEVTVEEAPPRACSPGCIPRGGPAASNRSRRYAGDTGGPDRPAGSLAASSVFAASNSLWSRGYGRRASVH